ncbi:hypothetical protein [Streptomyces sp. G45]|uniref:hypothetical protein n=1 Tax=Streptomyces sp. G45 TaxID=3406627 RepID=UPI003C16486C
MRRWARLPNGLRGALIVIPAALITLNGSVWLGCNKGVAIIAALAVGGIATELVTRHERRQAARSGRNGQ